VLPIDQRIADRADECENGSEPECLPSAADVGPLIEVDQPKVPKRSDDRTLCVVVADRAFHSLTFLNVYLRLAQASGLRTQLWEG
jgi:hypothetical protein